MEKIINFKVNCKFATRFQISNLLHFLCPKNYFQVKILYAIVLNFIQKRALNWVHSECELEQKF